MKFLNTFAWGRSGKTAPVWGEITGTISKQKDLIAYVTGEINKLDVSIAEINAEILKINGSLISFSQEMHLMNQYIESLQADTIEFRDNINELQLKTIKNTEDIFTNQTNIAVNEEHITANKVKIETVENSIPAVVASEVAKIASGISISDSQQSSNWDRTLTLTDRNTNKSQGLKLEFNSSSPVAVPINYMMSENETWTGKWYRESASVPAKKVYHVNKIINVTLSKGQSTPLSFFSDVEEPLSVWFKMQIGATTWYVPTFLGGLEVVKEANGSWVLANHNGNTITIKTMNFEYIKKS